MNENQPTEAVRILRACCLEALAAVVAVAASYLCPHTLFGMTTFLGGFGFALALAAMAVILHNSVGWVLSGWFCKNTTSPGRLWASAWAFQSYFLGLLFVRWMFAGTVLMSAWGIFVFAVITTLIFWALWLLAVRAGWVKPFRTWTPLRVTRQG